MNYKQLLFKAERSGIEVLENEKIGKFKGLCINDTISLSYKIEDPKEKKCIMAEEIGHYKTTYGNILDQNKLQNRKEERRGRAWAYKKLVPLEDLLEAYESDVKNRYELADFLEITEEFLIEAIVYYRHKYGVYYKYQNYIIYFEPLGIAKKI